MAKASELGQQPVPRLNPKREAASQMRQKGSPREANLGHSEVQVAFGIGLGLLGPSNALIGVLAIFGSG
jgi:hypothetical protein